MNCRAYPVVILFYEFVVEFIKIFVSVIKDYRFDFGAFNDVGDKSQRESFLFDLSYRSALNGSFDIGLRSPGAATFHLISCFHRLLGCFWPLLSGIANASQTDVAFIIGLPCLLLVSKS